MDKIFRILLILLSVFNSCLFSQNLDSVGIVSPEKYAEELSRNYARSDIENGDVLIWIRGNYGPSNEAAILAEKYGFSFIMSGCTPTDEDKYYNDEVINYLSKRNGNGWWKNFSAEIFKREKDKIPIIPLIINQE